ncbi:hypothetical protein L2E82_45431 [Cichorium intybus]|uniref:Uncharacterized protein n=1 Tax=Cichorium intybus TaxID=13427 RepID=A0ACB8ZTB1_CICIN|nr:hypothetical protein L2E82_45431 [Cichorium intybus]
MEDSVSREEHQEARFHPRWNLHNRSSQQFQPRWNFGVLILTWASFIVVLFKGVHQRSMKSGAHLQQPTLEEEESIVEEQDHGEL